MFYRYIYLLLFTLAISPANAERRALLIGIDQYPNLSLQKQLEGSVSDAKDIANLAMTKLGYKSSQIKSLHNKEATKAAILEAIDTWLIKGTSAEDKVLFYFSGHGGQTKDVPPLDESGANGDGFDETIVPSDAKAEGEDNFSNIILDDTLKVLFKQLEDKGVEALIIIDSCHSGTILRGHNYEELKGTMVKTITRPKPIVIANDKVQTRGMQRSRKQSSLMDDLEPTPLRTIWTASSPTQLAFVHTGKKGGVFTKLLIEGVKQAAVWGADKILSNKELFDYISSGSDQFCKENNECVGVQKTITPTLEISPEKRLSSFVQSGFTMPPTINENDFPTLKWEGLNVIIKEGNKLSLGHEIRIDIKNTSGKKGQLLILDQRADGKLVQLYPNNFRQENWLEAESKFYLPHDKRWGFSIRASVKGKSNIIAILIHDPVDLASLYAQTENLQMTPVPDSNHYLGQLMEILQQVWTGDETNRRLEFSSGKFEYEVTK